MNNLEWFKESLNKFVAHSQALLGNVALQAGACFVSSQSGDWELAQVDFIHGSTTNGSACGASSPFMPFGYERNQPLTVRPELDEGLAQSFLK